MQDPGVPWFVAMFDDAPATLPFGLGPAGDIEVCDRGEIDLVSGRLCIAHPRLFATSIFTSDPPSMPPALDLEMGPGPWNVETFRGRAGVYALRLRHPQRMTVTSWQPATVRGSTPRVDGGGELLIGDADASQMLGDDENAAQMLVPLLQGASQAAGWERPTAAATARMLPGSRCRSYYAPDGLRAPDRWERRPRWSQVVVGLADDKVAEVVIDHVASYAGEPYAMVDDAWATAFEGGGGRLLAPEDGLQLADESADLTQLFAEPPPQEWHARVLELGVAPLQGRLVALNPGKPDRSLRLPVEVPAGRYPAFAMVGSGSSGLADVVLVRLGAARPQRWYEVTYEDEPAFIPLGTSYALMAEEVIEAAERSPTVAAELGGLRDRGVDAVSLTTVTGQGAIVNSELGGTGPAWCYLGLSDAGDVAAALVTLVTDPIDAHRSPDPDTTTG